MATTVRKLCQRGVGQELAARTAGPHGPWRVSNSPALAIALPIAYFDSLGLPRLFEYLHEQADTETLPKSPATNGIGLTCEAVKYYRKKLSSEWLTLRY
jgi:hypothetical protein